MPATYQIRFSDSPNEIEWFGSRGFYEFADAVGSQSDVCRFN